MQCTKQIFTAFVVSLLLALLAGCSQYAQKNPAEQVYNNGTSGVQATGGDELARAGNFEKVEFKTEDGFTIYGNLLRGNKKAVLLLHQFTLDKSSYDSLAKKLEDSNFTVLAIDLRGHGESLDQNGQKRSYADFSETDFRNMTKDVKAAKRNLQQQGYTLYAVVGASIGANTALNYSAMGASVERIILLSPGLNFKGIDTEIQGRSVRAKTLIVASDDDSYSFGSGKALQKIIAGSEFMGLTKAGHGTNMFRGTFLEEDIVKWLMK